MKNSDRKVCSRIKFDAKLLGRMESVRDSLSAYPGLHRTNYGTLLRYSIDDDCDCTCLLELRKDSIILEVQSECSPLHFIDHSLLKLLSVSALLCNNYEFDMRSVFPYLIFALGRNGNKTMKNIIESKREPISSDSHLMLARRINSLRKEVFRLRAANTLAGNTTCKIILNAIYAVYNGDCDISDVEIILGIGKEEIMGAIKQAHLGGYRVISNEQGRLRLSRL